MRRSGLRAVAVRAGVGTVAALVLALSVYAVARGTGEAFTVAPPGQPASEVTAGAVAFATVVGGLLGAVLAVVALRTSRPRRTMLVVGLVGLVLSFFNPASATDSFPTIAWLCLMHVAVAVAVVGALWSAVPDSAAEASGGRP